MGRREAKRTYELSANLIQTWLARYDDGEMTVADIESSMINEYEAKIAAPRS
jgi:ribosomal protein L21E